MKRSQMLTLIADYFYHCNVDPEESMQKADKLLTAIESAGMLPPATLWRVNNEPEKMIWEQVHDYYLWEPEYEA